MRPAGREPTIQGLTYNRPTHYATEFGVKNRRKYLLYAKNNSGHVEKISAISINVTVY